MPLITDLSDIAPFRGGWLTIGNFDGVHAGHQAIVQRLCERAHAAGLPAVVLTFSPHPIALLRPESTPPALTTLKQRADLLMQLGIDCVFAYRTTRDLLGLSPNEFFQQLIVEQIQAVGIVEGPNFYFGKNREGDVHLLQRLCEERNLTLEVVTPALLHTTDFVSSSHIRQLLSRGDVSAVTRLLNRAYSVTGRVAEGAQRGRTLGFPTANLTGIETLIPCQGVYAALTHVAGKRVPTALHIGPNPTFGEEGLKVEAHLLDFQGDLYARELTVEFVEHIREVRSFTAVEDLKTQLQKDIAAIRQLVEHA